MKIVSSNKLLQELIKSNNQYISRSRLLNFFENQDILNQKIKELQQQNYLIEIISDDLIKLHEPFPYFIVIEEIANNLENMESPLLLFIEQTDSTNMLAKQIVHRYVSPFILITREQTAGKGRMNRSWQMTADKDIAMTFVQPFNIPHHLMFSIIRMVSLAICKILNNYLKDMFFIKWPNDIVLQNGQKICGILTETLLEDNSKFLLIGIGININSEELPEYATSLKQILNCEVNINQIYSEIIKNIMFYWDNFPNNLEEIIVNWNEYLIWKDEPVILSVYDEEYQGILKTIEQDGTIVLEICNQEYKFSSGDLTNLKLRKYESKE